MKAGLFAKARRQFGKVLINPEGDLCAAAAGSVSSFAKDQQAGQESCSCRPKPHSSFASRWRAINVCLFCIYIGRCHHQSVDEPSQFDALEQYGRARCSAMRNVPPLDYVTELTKQKKVETTTFVRVARYYTERQICEIRLAGRQRALLQHDQYRPEHPSDMLCDIGRRPASSFVTTDPWLGRQPTDFARPSGKVQAGRPTRCVSCASDGRRAATDIAEACTEWMFRPILVML